jgi:hypothetical protein
MDGADGRVGRSGLRQRGTDAPRPARRSPPHAPHPLRRADDHGDGAPQAADAGIGPYVVLIDTERFDNVEKVEIER